MYRDVIGGWVHLAPEGRHVYSRAIRSSFQAPEGRHVYGNEMLRRCEAVCFEYRFYRGNNPCNLRYPFHLRFRQMAYIAPLGLCWLIS